MDHLEFCSPGFSYSDRPTHSSPSAGVGEGCFRRSTRARFQQDVGPQLTVHDGACGNARASSLDSSIRAGSVDSGRRSTASWLRQKRFAHHASRSSSPGGARREASLPPCDAASPPCEAAPPPCGAAPQQPPAYVACSQGLADGNGAGPPIAPALPSAWCQKAEAILARLKAAKGPRSGAPAGAAEAPLLRGPPAAGAPPHGSDFGAGPGPLPSDPTTAAPQAAPPATFQHSGILVGASPALATPTCGPQASPAASSWMQSCDIQDLMPDEENTSALSNNSRSPAIVYGKDEQPASVSRGTKDPGSVWNVLCGEPLPTAKTALDTRDTADESSDGGASSGVGIDDGGGGQSGRPALQEEHAQRPLSELLTPAGGACSETLGAADTHAGGPVAGAPRHAGSPGFAGSPPSAGSPSRPSARPPSGSPPDAGSPMRACSPPRSGYPMRTIPLPRVGSPACASSSQDAGSPPRTGAPRRAGAPPCAGLTPRTDSPPDAGSPMGAGPSPRAGSPPPRAGPLMRAGCSTRARYPTRAVSPMRPGSPPRAGPSPSAGRPPRAGPPPLAGPPLRAGSPPRTDSPPGAGSPMDAGRSPCAGYPPPLAGPLARDGSPPRAGYPARRGSPMHAGSPPLAGSPTCSRSPIRAGSAPGADSPPPHAGSAPRAGSPMRAGPPLRAGSPARPGSPLDAGSPVRGSPPPLVSAPLTIGAGPHGVALHDMARSAYGKGALLRPPSPAQADSPLVQQHIHVPRTRESEVPAVLSVSDSEFKRIMGRDIIQQVDDEVAAWNPGVAADPLNTRASGVAMLDVVAPRRDPLRRSSSLGAPRRIGADPLGPVRGGPSPVGWEGSPNSDGPEPEEPRHQRGREAERGGTAALMTDKSGRVLDALGRPIGFARPMPGGEAARASVARAHSESSVRRSGDVVQPQRVSVNTRVKQWDRRVEAGGLDAHASGDASPDEIAVLTGVPAPNGPSVDEFEVSAMQPGMSGMTDVGSWAQSSSVGPVAPGPALDMNSPSIASSEVQQIPPDVAPGTVTPAAVGPAPPEHADHHGRHSSDTPDAVQAPDMAASKRCQLAGPVSLPDHLDTETREVHRRGEDGHLSTEAGPPVDEPSESSGVMLMESVDLSAMMQEVEKYTIKSFSRRLQGPGAEMSGERPVGRSMPGVGEGSTSRMVDLEGSHNLGTVALSAEASQASAMPSRLESRRAPAAVAAASSPASVVESSVPNDDVSECRFKADAALGHGAAIKDPPDEPAIPGSAESVHCAQHVAWNRPPSVGSGADGVAAEKDGAPHEAVAARANPAGQPSAAKPGPNPSPAPGPHQGGMNGGLQPELQASPPPLSIGAAAGRGGCSPQVTPVLAKPGWPGELYKICASKIFSSEVTAPHGDSCQNPRPGTAGQAEELNHGAQQQKHQAMDVAQPEAPDERAIPGPTQQADGGDEGTSAGTKIAGSEAAGDCELGVSGEHGHLEPDSGRTPDQAEPDSGHPSAVDSGRPVAVDSGHLVAVDSGLPAAVDSGLPAAAAPDPDDEAECGNRGGSHMHAEGDAGTEDLGTASHTVALQAEDRDGEDAAEGSAAGLADGETVESSGSDTTESAGDAPLAREDVHVGQSPVEELLGEFIDAAVCSSEQTARAQANLQESAPAEVEQGLQDRETVAAGHSGLQMPCEAGSSAGADDGTSGANASWNPELSLHSGDGQGMDVQAEVPAEVVQEDLPANTDAVPDASNAVTLHATNATSDQGHLDVGDCSGVAAELEAGADTQPGLSEEALGVQVAEVTPPGILEETQRGAVDQDLPQFAHEASGAAHGDDEERRSHGSPTGTEQGVGSQMSQLQSAPLQPDLVAGLAPTLHVPRGAARNRAVLGSIALLFLLVGAVLCGLAPRIQVPSLWRASMATGHRAGGRQFLRTEHAPQLEEWTTGSTTQKTWFAPPRVELALFGNTTFRSPAVCSPDAMDSFFAMQSQRTCGPATSRPRYRFKAEHGSHLQRAAATMLSEVRLVSRPSPPLLIALFGNASHHGPPVCMPASSWVWQKYKQCGPAGARSRAKAVRPLHLESLERVDEHQVCMDALATSVKLARQCLDPLDSLQWRWPRAQAVSWHQDGQSPNMGSVSKSLASTLRTNLAMLRSYLVRPAESIGANVETFLLDPHHRPEAEFICALAACATLWLVSYPLRFILALLLPGWFGPSDTASDTMAGVNDCVHEADDRNMAASSACSSRRAVI